MAAFRECMCCLRNIALCDYQESVTTRHTHTYTDGQTDRHLTKWSLCAAMLRRWHNKLCIDKISLILKYVVLRALYPWPIQLPIYRSIIRGRLLHWQYFVFNNWCWSIKNSIHLRYAVCILLRLSTYFPNSPRILNQRCHSHRMRACCQLLL